MKRFLLSIILAILFVVSPASAEFFSDVIVTSPNGIWTDSRAYTTLQAAITAVGGNNREIVVAKEEVCTNLTVPSNVQLRFIRGGSIANSGQLNINTKNISAGDYQIFTGAGDIDFCVGSTVRSAWFSNTAEAINVTSDDNLTLIISKHTAVASNCTVGNNVTLKWEAMNHLLVANPGITISNIKNIEAGNYQLFGGAGDFDFLDGTQLNLSWFLRLRLAVTWVENERVTLVVDEPSTVSYDNTVPSNVSVVVAKGGMLSIDAGRTVTFNGSLEAGLYQIFAGAGTVNFGPGAVREAYPHWRYTGLGSWHTAINSIIAGLSSGDIWFNGGSAETYAISGSIVPKTGVNLKSDGARIFLSNNSDVSMVHFTSATNAVIIEGLWFDGNGSNQIRADTVNIISAEAAVVEGLTVQNCKFQNSSFGGIRLYNSVDVDITNNRFYDYDSTSIVFYFPNSATITNNIFDNTGIILTASANAISVAFAVGDVVIIGNQINMSDTSSVDSFGIEARDIERLVINGNIIHCNSGTMNGGISVTSVIDACRTISIVGNSIYQPANIAGIEVVNILEGCTISGNIIDGAGCTSIAVNQVGTGVNITGNTISNYGGSGISCQMSGSLFSSSYGVLIVGNVLIDGTSVVVHAISLNSTPSESTVIANNTIKNHGARGIQVITTSDASRYMRGFVVSGNTIDNCTVGISFSGTDHSYHSISNNVIRNCVGASYFQGTNYKISDNIGFATENSGLATLANGTVSVVVDHGLAVTPVAGDIVVTPIELWGAMTEFYVDTLTATQFRIRSDQDPTQDVDFAWSAIAQHN